MDRRKFMIGVGGSALGGSALLGSGAFSRIESQRRVKIEVAEDPDAYLGLDECPDSPNSSYVRLDGSGHLEVEMSDDNETEGGGQGVNSDSFTYFDNLFQICNQGKQPVGIWIEADDNPELDDPPEGYEDDLPRVQFYNTDNPDERVAEKADAFTLEVGDCKCIGMRVMTKGLDAGDQLLENDEIVIHADSETLTADGPVRNASTGDRYTTIQAAIDDAEPSDTIEVLEGTMFEEDPEIDKPLSLVAVSNTKPTIEGRVFIGNNPSNPMSADGTVIDGFEIVEPAPVEGAGQGIGVTESADVVIRNNDFEGFRTQISLDFAGGDVEDITIQGNTFANVDAEFGTAVGATENVDGLAILNNDFINNRNDIGLAYTATDVTIEGNDFEAGDSKSYISNRNKNDPPSTTIVDENEFDPDADIREEFDGDSDRDQIVPEEEE